MQRPHELLVQQSPAWQVPLQLILPTGQTPPQGMLGGMQLEPQSRVPVPQTTSQALPVQVWPLGQQRPFEQLPEAQVPLQHGWVASPQEVQLPPMQTAPVPQSLPSPALPVW